MVNIRSPKTIFVVLVVFILVFFIGRHICSSPSYEDNKSEDGYCIQNEMITCYDGLTIIDYKELHPQIIEAYILIKNKDPERYENATKYVRFVIISELLPIPYECSNRKCNFTAALANHDKKTVYVDDGLLDKNLSSIACEIWGHEMEHIIKKHKGRITEQEEEANKAKADCLEKVGHNELMS